MTAESEQPTPGWYPDPSRVYWWRWWDGTDWTDHTSGEGDAPSPPTASVPGPPVPVSGPVPPMPPTPAGQGVYTVVRRDRGAPDGVPPSVRFASELRLSPWGVLGFLGFGVGTALNLLRFTGAHGYYEQLFRTYRSQFESGVFNSKALPTEPSWAATFGSFASLVLGVAILCILLWQYRAARTGRALGYPAKRGPGLGVGGWFIPVVNLWFPYQALRDCLPTDHRARRWLLPCWLLYLVGGALNAVGIYLIYRGNGAYLPVLWAGFVCQVVFAVGGAEFVRAVRADHVHRLAVPDDVR